MSFFCRLSSHINGYNCFQIELSRGYNYEAFHDDLKKLYDMAGVKNKHTVFLFTDTQVNIVMDKQLNILSFGPKGQYKECSGTLFY